MAHFELAPPFQSARALVEHRVDRGWGPEWEIDQGETERVQGHFASAREAFNMVAAAVDGKEGPPGDYRDYKLRQIMHERAAARSC